MTIIVCLSKVACNGRENVYWRLVGRIERVVLRGWGTYLFDALTDFELIWRSVESERLKRNPMDAVANFCQQMREACDNPKFINRSRLVGSRVRLRGSSARFERAFRSYPHNSSVQVRMLVVRLRIFLPTWSSGSSESPLRKKSTHLC